MRPKIDIRPETRLVLSPMLQQALHVLQLPTQELTELVNQELAENPMLEEGKDGDFESPPSAMDNADPSAPAEAETREVDLEEIGKGLSESEQASWDEYFSNEEYEVPTHEREYTSDRLEPQVAKQQTLAEHLLWQFRLVSRSEAEFQIGETIIGNLDERGFLPLALEEIVRETNADPETVADVLATIQTLDPVGVASRDIKESLLIQLRYLSERNSLAEVIVEKHFEALERNQVDSIARAEKTTRQDVLAAAKVIAGLDPYPGRHQFTNNVEYVIPDVVLEKNDDQYVIQVKDESVPELRICKAYRQLLRRGSGITAETRLYLNDRLQRAIGLIRSIDQRHKTLYRVVEMIVEVQKDFFEKGIEFLKPLTLHEIAARVELHESTISRVTSHKYIQTPRGLLELKYFFSSQIKTADGGNVSSKSVKAAIQELIMQENSLKPLTDQRLMELMNERGLDIKRRTVAKYREAMNIMPTSRRRRLE